MGLQNTEVAVAATFALKDITRDCYSSVQPFGEQILQSCMVYYISIFDWILSSFISSLP